MCGESTGRRPRRLPLPLAQLKPLRAQLGRIPGLQSGVLRRVRRLPVSIIRRLLKCERAATRLEYLLIAALLGLLALQSAQLYGPPVG